MGEAFSAQERYASGIRNGKGLTANAQDNVVSTSMVAISFSGLAGPLYRATWLRVPGEGNMHLKKGGD
ncbi:hypothetical protein AWB82_04175 [Caballeronia glebae]|uniref:Uncharacterized protein n=1 Tax=Caballeronia glebae TaxID=1777143 RepID=A0A158BJA4_9BURK|nr:hypothetical protein [Caballeronia glebae]SAK70103.1 hypothetical protein AWB82_04175 [Caballeronia glebae]